MATAYQGFLPNVAHATVNTSYTISFEAPTTKCIPASRSILSQLGVGGYSTAMGSPNKWYNYEYLSWTPSRSILVPDNVKYKFYPGYFGGRQNKYKQISGIASNNTDGLSSFLGQYQELPPSIFVAYAWIPSNESSPTYEALNCSFFDATYTVHFDFPNGNQTVEIISVDVLANPLKLSAPIWNNCKQGNQTGTILTHKEVGYQALIESLGRALVGTMAFEDGLHQSSNLVVDQTSVMNTDLVYSNELAWMYNLGQHSHNVLPWMSDFTKQTLNGSSRMETNMTVAASIEQLFHNMTLSLFSEKAVLSPSASYTNVTTTSAENVYSYAWTQLVLAYGVAIAVTLVTVIVGCVILLANGAAYSGDFSTFLRLVRGQHIDEVVAVYDYRNGADPLPKALAKASIQIDGVDAQASNVPKKSPLSSNQSSSTVEQSEWTGMLSKTPKQIVHWGPMS